jgi:predicted ATP-dependent protease
MIPAQHVRHLLLDDEVLNSVKEGLFTVWSVSSIDEGIEILTGVKAGKPGRGGHFTRGSIHERTKSCLRSWLERSAKLKRSLNKKTKRDDEAE